MRQQPIGHPHGFQSVLDSTPQYAYSHVQPNHGPQYCEPTYEARVAPLSIPSPISIGLTDAQLYEYLFLPHEAEGNGPGEFAPICHIQWLNLLPF